jgi:hypothetical protein
MESSAAEPPVRVYRASRWPIRFLGGFFLALGVAFFVPTRAVVFLVLFGGMGALFLVAGERRQVRVSSRGVVSVPPLGRSRSYAWSDIGGFVAHRYVARYSGWVAAMLVHDRWVNLPATQHGSLGERSRAAVQDMVDRLNAELERARRGR